MTQCMNCIFWKANGICDKIDLDGVKPPDDSVRIKVDVWDDSGLTAVLQTGPKFSCSLGIAKA